MFGWFNDLGIRAKLLLAVGLVVALLGGAMVFTLLRMQSTDDRFINDSGAKAQAALYASELRSDFQAQHQNLKDMLLRGADPASMAKYSAAFEDAAKTVTAKHDQLAADLARLNDKDSEAFLATFDSEHNAYTTAFAAAMKAVQGPNGFDQAAGDAIMKGKDTNAQNALQSLSQRLDKASSASESAAASQSRQTTWIAITTLIVAVVVSGVVGFFLARMIANGIKEAAAAAKSIARGNVSVRLQRNSKDELGDLAHSFTEMTDYLGEMVGTAEAVSRGDLMATVQVRGSEDALGNALSRMIDNLRALVGEVKDNAGQILSAADQLQEASDQMAAATGQIATAINEVTRSTVALSSLSQDSAREVEQVSAGSEEMAAAVRTTASSAGESRREANSMGERIAQVATQSEQVATSANDSKQAAVEGQKAVMHAVASMEAIARAVERTSHTVDQLGEYGQQIGDIVKVIDEIAAQTNLLALNAAIEAARAGEQGRGFAVVADNVRQLAERSSQSTKEIAALIGKVQQGTSEAVEAMAAGVKDVQEGQQITSQAGKALDAIIGSVQDAAQRMQQIAKDVQGLSSGAERIVGSADEIARLTEAAASSAASMADGTGRVTEAIVQVSATSEQTSASAEEVSASTEELSAQSEELAATANSMKELARQLNDAASRFKWEGGARTDKRRLA